MRADEFESRCEENKLKVKAETWRAVAEINRLVNTVLIKKAVVFRKALGKKEGGTTAEGLPLMHWISSISYRPSFQMVPLNKVESTQTSPWHSTVHWSKAAVFLVSFVTRFDCLFTSLALLSLKCWGKKLQFYWRVLWFAREWKRRKLKRWDSKRWSELAKENKWQLAGCGRRKGEQSRA